jgi:type VI secretion system protein ImpH
MDSLTTRLLAVYPRFNVFQLMRLLLLRAPRKHGHLAPAPRVRFRADLSAAFPGREFSRLELLGADVDGQAGPELQEIHIHTPNFCITGPLGPLPEPFTEWLRDQSAQHRYATRDFLDIFNQRSSALRFEVKAAMLHELTGVAPAESRVGRNLACVAGMGASAQPRQVPVPERSWMALADMLGNRRRSAAGIVQLLSFLFGSPVKLEQWVGAWRPIEQEDRIALGARNQQLGRRSVLGTRVWDVQARLRITIGQLGYGSLCALLPPAPHDTRPAPGYEQFAGLLRLLLDRQCDCEVRLHAGEAPPPATLRARSARPGYIGLRLGQTAWLGQSGEAARFLVPAEAP